MKVLLLGPDIKCKGGIATVLRNYLDFSLEFDINYLFIPVRGDGGKLIKLFQTIYAFFRTFKALLLGRVDIIHAHPSEYIGFWRYFPFFLISKLFRRHLIFHIHGGAFNEFYEGSNRMAKLLIRSVLKSCDAVVVLSPFWRKYFECIGIKTTVVPNPVQVPGINRYNCKARDVSYVGFIEERKGVFDLLKAFARLNGNSAFLHICGSGDDKRLLDDIHVLGKGSTIIPHGWVSATAREEIFEKTAVFALPSYYEALPMAIIEAMAFGIPVVSTRVGAIPELVEQGIHGLIFEPGDVNSLEDSLELLLGDEEMRARMSENCYSKVRNEYGIDCVIPKLVLLYNEVYIKTA